MTSPILSDGQGTLPAPHVSALRFRIGTAADLPQFAELLEPGFLPPTRIREQLIPLWQKILAHRSKIFAVIEELGRPHPGNIAALALSVFVTDRFFEAFCASPRPQLSVFIYERMLAGEDVLLTEEQQRAAQATGLNLVVLHFGMRNWNSSDTGTQQKLNMGGAAFFFFHNGLHLNSILNEVFGPQSARYMEQGGFRLFRDFQRDSPSDFAHLQPTHHPYLYRMLRDWAEPGAVNPFSQMFFPALPLLGFAPLERRILEGALLNESDGEIAGRLAISADTVKKTWRHIFVRVERKLPALIPASKPAPPGRGQEKRRHLLAYVRNHLEELRPNPAQALPRRD